MQCLTHTETTQRITTIIHDNTKSNFLHTIYHTYFVLTWGRELSSLMSLFMRSWLLNPVTKYCNKMNLTTIFQSTAQFTTFDFHRADMNNTLSVNTLSTTRNMAIIKNGRIINPQLFY